MTTASLDHGGLGHEREMTLFAALTAELAAGRGRSVLVEGEPGIGKSALLRAALAEARARGARPGSGPEIRVLSAACDEFRQRFSQPTATPPLLWIGACRPLPRRDDIARLRTILQAGNGSVVSLGRLTPENVSALVDRLVGGVPGPRLAARLELAAGNPLYVRELLGVLSRSKALSYTDGIVELVNDAPDGAPPYVADDVSLTAAIADRLDFLSPETRQVLRTATLLGPNFTDANSSASTVRL